MNEVGVAAASKRLGIAQSTLYNWRSATASGAVRSRVGDETRAAPVVELVKATPPPRGSLAEQLRPLLEQIMAAADHDWFRVVVFPTRNQAERHANRIRGRYPPQWEWRSATVGDKSALYVRWLDRGEPDIRIEVG